MNRIIEVINSSGDKVAQFMPDECNAIINREVNADWSIIVDYPIPSFSYLGEDKSEYLTTWGAKLRVIDFDDSTDYQTFFIIKVDRIRMDTGSVIVKVQGIHDSMQDLATEVITEIHYMYGVDPSDVLTKILSYSTNWSSGTVNPSEKISIDIGLETVLSALQKLANICNAEWTADEVNLEIDLLTSLGSDNSVEIRPDKNLISLSNKSFSRSVVNKIYGFGGGQPAATLEQALHIVKSYDAGVITVEGNKVVPEDDSWNTNYEVVWYDGTHAGAAHQITDCSAGATNDTITVTVGLTISAGDRFYIRELDNTDIKYIRAGASIAARGTIEGVFRDSRYQDIVNMVRDGSLSRGYTSGVCDEFTDLGAGAYTENTDATYITYGTSSQKIVGGLIDVDGIYQAFTGLTTGEFFTMFALVYIEAGSVYMQWSDDTGAITTETIDTVGWNRFSLQGKVRSGTNLNIYLMAGSEGTTFYVDAVQVTKGLDHVSFTANDQKKDLWDAAYDKLMQIKDPVVKYDLSFVDLYRSSVGEFPNEKISIGDTVYISDDEIGLSKTSARVVKLVDNIFEPEKSKFTISNVLERSL